jgi:hypothetical protein
VRADQLCGRSGALALLAPASVSKPALHSSVCAQSAAVSPCLLARCPRAGQAAAQVGAAFAAARCNSSSRASELRQRPPTGARCTPGCLGRATQSQRAPLKRWHTEPAAQHSPLLHIALAPHTPEPPQGCPAGTLLMPEHLSSAAVGWQRQAAAVLR